MILDLHIYTVEVPPDPQAPFGGEKTGRALVSIAADSIAAGEFLVHEGETLSVRSVIHPTARLGDGSIHTVVYVERRVVNEERRKRIEEAAKAAERGRR